MTRDALDLVFKALADRSRRRMVDIVGESPGCNVNHVCAGFGMARISVMQHLDVLESAGLIRSERVWRERRLFVDAAPIRLLEERWLSRWSRSGDERPRARTPEPELVADPVASAKTVGLRHVSDRGPGIRRLGAGRAFRYVGPDGERVRDGETLGRIRSLGVPPAWTSVWICPIARGHLQASGRDARERKQYRYHPRWRAFRDETKFARMIAFARALPKLRARARRDLALPGLSRDKVLAAVVRLLETTAVRVGNEEYARDNRSFGLTTLEDRHVDVAGPALRLRFRGKAGKAHDVAVADRRLARIVRRCRDLPGQELFQYEGEDGVVRSVDSADVNDYVRATAGEEFSAKDFRTWAGTVLAASALRETGASDSAARARTNVVRAIECVARKLGNTPSICRKCYVHPAVIEAYLDGRVIEPPEAPERRAGRARRPRDVVTGLEPEEAALVALLRGRRTPS